MRFSTAILSLPLMGLLSMGLHAAEQRDLDRAKRLESDGNYREAVELVRPLISDAETSAETAAEALQVAEHSLSQLGEWTELDALLSSAAEAHAASPGVIRKVAASLRQIPHHGRVVGGRFERGSYGGGLWVEASELDRRRALRLLVSLLKDGAGDREELSSAFYLELADTLLWHRDGRLAWLLQRATDLSEPVEYDRPQPAPDTAFAPVGPEGEPILYGVPDSWSAATSDGERWRWALQQASQAGPGPAAQATRRRADFLHGQFGVRTLQVHPWWGGGGGDEASEQVRQRMIRQLRELSDEETIAQLAPGIRRFALPEEHQFIRLYRQLAESDEANTGVEACQRLAEVYEDRRQLPTAARWWQKGIDRASGQTAQSMRNRLKQITEPLAEFLPQRTSAAGEGANAVLRFRNATEVRLTARPIDLERLLRDIHERLHERQPEWNRLNVEQLAGRMLNGDAERYTSDSLASWTVPLEPAEDHLDRVETITTPLQAAGAYWLEAEVGEGNRFATVVWVADTTIVQKPAAGGSLYYVADARTGRPVAGAELTLWGLAPQPRERRWLVHEARLKTDRNGLAVPGAGQLKERYQYIAIARTAEGRLAVLGLRTAHVGRIVPESYRQVAVFGATSQPAYRPDQEIEFKLWARRVGYDLTAENAQSEGNSVQIEVYDPRGTRVHDAVLKTDAYGGVAGSLRLPAGSTLGRYQIQATAKIDSRPRHGSVAFLVEEYKKPEFEVTVDAPERPAELGETVVARVRAAYYFGGPVTDAEVRVKVERRPHESRWYPPTPWDWLYGPGYWWFSPAPVWYPGYDRWIGCLPPWWPRQPGGPELVAEISGRIGADGTIEVPIDTSVAQTLFGDESQQYTITAEVRDASRRTVQGSGTVLVSAEPFEVFAWTHRGHYRVGDAVTAEFRVATIDDRPVEGEGRLDLLRLSYAGDEVRETEVASWELDPDGEGRATQRLRVSQAGQYRLRYRVKSADGAEQEGGEILTVLGPGVDGRDFRFTALEVVPDQRDYAPGETAELQIRTDRLDSWVLLFRRPQNGVYPRPEMLHLDGKVTLQELAIKQGDMPNVYVEVLTVSDGEVHTVVRQLTVPPEKRVLDVALETPEEEYEPGAEVPLEIRVTGPDGRPFAGQALVRVYDRALDAIAGEVGPGDIREGFWGWRRNHHQRSDHTLARVEPNVYLPGSRTLQPIGAFGSEPGLWADDAVRRGMGGGFGGARMEAGSPMRMHAAAESAAAESMAMDKQASDSGSDAPALRSEFADSILWVAAIETDEQGRARLELPLPDNLTAWKIESWVLGPAAEVGSATGEVRVRKPLMIRPQAPRFAVQGDRLTLSGVVHNDTGRAAEVRVTLELDDDVLEPAGDLEHTVRVAEGASVRVDWPVRAVAEGEAIVRLIARSETAGDAVQITLPVKVHGMLRTEAWAGTVRDGEPSGEIEIAVPAERRPEQSVLEIRYSPTLAAAMLDALPYLVEYPYGCTEQVLNRFLPAVITRQTLQRMDLDLEALAKERNNLNAQERGSADKRRSGWQRLERDPVFDEQVLSGVVAEGVRRLAEMQNGDGGWGWFSGVGEKSWPHTTAVVVRGLVVARDADVALPEGMLQRGLEWLDRHRDEQLRRRQLPSDDPAYKPVMDNLDALVHHILLEAERPNNAMAERLYADRLNLSLYGKTLVALALLKGDDARWAMVRRNVEQFLQQDAENETAWLEGDRTAWWHWYGDSIEANAMYLKLLARVEPRGAVAPRLVKWLLNNRKHATYWSSTRDTALCVEAMADYLRASGEATPEMTVEVWLDDRRLSEQRITPENLFTFDNVVRISGDALTDGAHTVRLVRRGGGNVYFNVYQTDFTLVDPIPAAGLEVKVERKYWRLVRDDQALQQAGKRGGAVAGERESYRREPLGDGERLEVGELVEVELVIESKNDYEYILLEDFKAAGLEPVDVRSGYVGGGLGAYQELRDDRVALFVRRLPQGTHGLSYRLRAEVPGRFSALPATAEGMYAPELAANSNEAKIGVVD